MVSNNSEHRATLRQWQLFILTVEKGSILAASAAANTDAAVVSREITKLEHLLQEPLLERSRSGVRPTWLGAQKYASRRQPSGLERKVCRSVQRSDG